MSDTTIADTNTPGAAVPGDLAFAYGDWSTTLSAIAPEGVKYLLVNGFNQSMVDAAALSKADKEGKTEEEIAAIVHSKRAARFEKILSGTIGARSVGAPKQTSLERTCHLVAVEMLKAALGKKGLKLPTKDNTIEVNGVPRTRDWLIAMKLSGKDKDAIVVEAQRRIDSSAVDDESLEELVG